MIKIYLLIISFLMCSTSAFAIENDSILALRDQFYANQKFFSNKDSQVDTSTKERTLDLLNFQIEYANCNNFNKRCTQSENAYRVFEKKYKVAPDTTLLNTTGVINQRQQIRLFSQVEMDLEYSVCQSDFNKCEKFQTLRNQYTNRYGEAPSLFDLKQAIQKKKLQDIKVEVKPLKPAKQIDTKLAETDLSKKIDTEVDEDVIVDANTCQWDTTAIRPRLLSGSTCTGARKICFGKVKCGEKSKYINCESHLCDSPTACAKASLK